MAMRPLFGAGCVLISQRITLRAITIIFSPRGGMTLQLVSYQVIRQNNVAIKEAIMQKDNGSIKSP